MRLGRTLPVFAALAIAGSLAGCSSDGSPRRADDAPPTVASAPGSTTTITTTTAPADPSALTFGGTSAIQAGTTEASLSTVGITPSAPKEHGCNTYSIPGASSLKAIAARGKVLGVLAASQGGSSSVHTAEGVRVGSTAAEVRQAYRGAQLTESYQGLASTNVILATDSAGQAIGFEFEGNSDASNHVDDSSTVRSIRAGTPDLARGFEVCSG